MKKILITGKDSYIGTSVENWLKGPKYSDRYVVDTVDMRGDEWQKTNFSEYDTVFHVAGIAHADVGSISAEQKQLYYKVNCDLTIEVAEKAKESSVRQFIFMSSIIVYGETTSVKKKKVITIDSPPTPIGFYGDSKWKAEQGINRLNSDAFCVAVLRPPMIYGKGCRGNYQLLKKCALKIPIFPSFPNERSMLHIDNLCELVRLIIDNTISGIFYPQNREYVNTAYMVREIAAQYGRKTKLTKLINWMIYLIGSMPGKPGILAGKAFGNLVYSPQLSNCTESLGDYQIRGFAESIRLTEKES